MSTGATGLSGMTSGLAVTMTMTGGIWRHSCRARRSGLSDQRRLQVPVSTLRLRTVDLGASTTSIRPRTSGPVNPTSWQFSGGLRPARSPMFDAMPRNRSLRPRPLHAHVALHSRRQNLLVRELREPAGSNDLRRQFWGSRMRGSIPVGAMSKIERRGKVRPQA